MIGVTLLVAFGAVFLSGLFLGWLTSPIKKRKRARRATALNPSVEDVPAGEQEDFMDPVQLPDIQVPPFHVSDRKRIRLSPDHPLAGAPSFSSSDPTVLGGSVDANDPNIFNLEPAGPGTATIKIVGQGDPDPGADELDQNLAFTIVADDAKVLNPVVEDVPAV